MPHSPILFIKAAMLPGMFKGLCNSYSPPCNLTYRTPQPQQEQCATMVDQSDLQYTPKQLTLSLILEAGSADRKGSIVSCRANQVKLEQSSKNWTQSPTVGLQLQALNPES